MNQNTLEQYAFAIGFDFELDSNAPSDPSEGTTTTLINSVGIAIQTAGLPNLESDRWDEFGQGRIFWGTKSECDAVKQVLSQFPLFLQEERNLDQGYYAHTTDTYYVNETGNLYHLRSASSNGEATTLEPIHTIPLDAYRLKTIDPSIQAAVERSLSPSELLPELLISSPSENEVASSLEKTGQEIEALRAQLAQQTAQISELETLRTGAVNAQATAEQAAHELSAQLTQQTVQIQTLEDLRTTTLAAQTTAEQNVNELRAQLAQQTNQLSELEALRTKTLAAQASVEQDATELRAQLAQQTAHIQELEALRTTISAAQVTAERDATELRAQLTQQTAHIQELERQITVFEDQIAFLQGVVATKIAPQALENLQAEFAQQTLHLQQVETRLAQAEGHVKSWETKAEQWIDPQSYTQIQQQLNAKATQVQELERVQDAVAIAAQKVDPAKYQALEQTLTDKTAQVEELRRGVVQLQRDLGEWQTVADSKVEWAEYQALQQELQRLQAKQKRGFWARLFG
jgi:hypothetical protein